MTKPQMTTMKFSNAHGHFNANICKKNHPFRQKVSMDFIFNVNEIVNVMNLIANILCL